jgi:DNA end-binding protein Ku
MVETGRVALAKYASRGKQYLVMVRAKDGGLVMQQLHYADEVRPFSEVPLGEARVGESELKLAIQLITHIARDEFRPEAYKDEAKQRVLELIQKKVDGEEVTIAAPEEPKAKVIDLMAALRASLGQVETKAEAPPQASPRVAAEPEGEGTRATDETTASRKPAKRVGRGATEARPHPVARAKVKAR